MNASSGKDLLFLKKKDERLYENDSFFSIFDAAPVSPGHALVIPRRHVASFFDLHAKEQGDFCDALVGTRDAIQKKNLRLVYEGLLQSTPVPEYLWDVENLPETSPDYARRVLASGFLEEKIEDFTIGINNGITAGRTIHHLHVQLIPRYAGDVEHTRGGVRNIFPKGDYTLR